jgi:hypothetical protein
MAANREISSCNKHLCESKIYKTRDHSLAMRELKKQIISEGISNFETDPRYVRLIHCKKTADETYYDEDMCKIIYPSPIPHPSYRPQPQAPQPSYRPQPQDMIENSYKYVSLIDPEQYKQSNFRVGLKYFLEKNYPIGTVFNMKYKNKTSGLYADMLEVQLPKTNNYIIIPKQTLVHFKIQTPQEPPQAPPFDPRTWGAPPKQRPKKPCATGKIRNPETGRCINDPALKATKAKTQKAPKTQKPCPAGKVRNSKTGRCINDPALKTKK